MPDDIITGKGDEDKVVQVERAPDPPRMIAPQENIEEAPNLLGKAERPLILVGKGMAWSRAEDEVRAFIERTQVPFLRSPMGKGVMPDDHPLSVAAARTLALQNADVVFLMGARFNWIFHFGQPPRYAENMKVIQLDIAPEEIGHNKATEVALVGDGKAIMAQLNQALAGRQWFHPKDTPWRQMISKKAAENAAMIKPQIDDDRRRPATTAPCAMSRPGCRRTRSSAPRAPVQWISASPNCQCRQCPLVPQRRHLRHDGGRPRASDRRRRRGARPAGRPPLRRLGDRLLGHGDGDARPLQLPGQDRRPQQWRHCMPRRGPVG